MLDTVLLKKPWSKKLVGDLPLYQATTMNFMPRVVQAFTTRQGGRSQSPYDTLNLSLNVGDVPERVHENRSRLALDLGFTENALATAQQVHGAGVAQVIGPTAAPIPGVDALVTDVPGVLLFLLFADCVPVYFYDPAHRAVGIAHSGWRGADRNIARATLRAMTDAFGTLPSACLAAIGPCIGGGRYEVGPEVADRFRSVPAGPELGGAVLVTPKNEFSGSYLLNLRQAVYGQLLAAGVLSGSIAVSDECTVTNRRDFFSHRRDVGRGSETTGRMAGVIGMTPRRP